jgi:2-dehydropantoate 2-reductase
VTVADALVAHDRDGTPHRPGDDFVIEESPEILADVDVCLVSVKSRDTSEAARILADVLPARAVVVSLQNGLRNPERLREHLQQRVVPGMVGYNVVRPEPAVFRQATRGPIVIGTASGRAAGWLSTLQEALRRVGHDLEIREDIEGVQAGKLLLNLNNVICAIAGVPIAASVRDATLRWCFCTLMREGLAVMKGAGIEPQPVVGLPLAWIARFMNLPNAIVLRVARRLVDIDPAAKSSTLVDLEAGKPTEIDDLSGEVVRLAEAAGMTAPCNALAVEAVHALEAAADPKPYWSPTTLAERLRARTRA